MHIFAMFVKSKSLTPFPYILPSQNQASRQRAHAGRKDEVGRNTPLLQSSSPPKVRNFFPFLHSPSSCCYGNKGLY
ncbi:hypothetical protein O6P43_002432 [Quillaja saponaria]|uniref:Uncharacterized protein n=1 Tax=Quillaja saponaria TaxID=32244 RepID=A0AAD7VKG1_QUISA|nr:hypothetical protein O6P43_002432 [Quillaja saponaria]